MFSRKNTFIIFKVNRHKKHYIGLVSKLKHQSRTSSGFIQLFKSKVWAIFKHFQDTYNKRFQTPGAFITTAKLLP